jgi:DNA-binding NarL/FixJ family response regulator
MQKITLVVVDDHPLFRQGVVDSFSLEADLLVVGQAANGEDALTLIRSMKPQVAVLDVNLPGLNGQQVMRQVVAERLPTRVILLTAYHDPEQIEHAMRGGAWAYCSKDIQAERLVQSIRQVVNGRYVIGEQAYTPRELERWLGAQGESGLRSLGEPGESAYPLSSREMEVLAFVTEGLSNKEIAQNLGISHQTVKNHVTAILRKLGVEDRTQAAIFALRRGWVRLYQENPPSQE